MKSRSRVAAIVVLICAIVALIVILSIKRGAEVSAPPPVILSDDDRTDAERILRSRINSLSPTPPKLGGRFEVQSVQWDDRGRARVTYGDGESTLEATASILTGSGRVKIGGFVVKE